MWSGWPEEECQYGMFVLIHLWATLTWKEGTACRLATRCSAPLAYRRALNWTPSEHLTSARTVERDLGKRLSAQRFPGGLLTRKRSQVQTLSRPPHPL
jgi:hypothetical protein